MSSDVLTTSASASQLDLAEAVRGLVDAWNTKDEDRLISLLDRDVVWHDPSVPAPIKGREQVRAFSRTVWGAFPDLKYTVKQWYPSEDGQSCAVWWRMDGTNLGPMNPPGFAPTGRGVTLEGVDIVELRARLVVKINTYFDPIATAEQLLGIRLQPQAGTFAEAILVRVQRALAWWVRFRRNAAKRTDAVG